MLIAEGPVLLHGEEKNSSGVPGREARGLGFGRIQRTPYPLFGLGREARLLRTVRLDQLCAVFSEHLAEKLELAFVLCAEHAHPQVKVHADPYVKRKRTVQ